MPDSREAMISVVVIGRNEGERLERCMRSVQSADTDGRAVELIYVDSDSTDGSAERAAALGARVLRVQPTRPSAAGGTPSCPCTHSSRRPTSAACLRAPRRGCAKSC
jgi:glycosyltransferase involved in cell wall biosynthesis